jgi:mRNA interferase MazF
VWRADLAPTRGTEQSGVRPVLVVQTDRANPHSPHTIVVPFTTRIRRQLLPSHVVVPAGESGLTQDSVALCEQISVIDLSRLVARLGDLSAQRMQEIADALKAILDLQWLHYFAWRSIANMDSLMYFFRKNRCLQRFTHELRTPRSQRRPY